MFFVHNINYKIVTKNNLQDGGVKQILSLMYIYAAVTQYKLVGEP